MDLSAEVCADIREFITANIDLWCATAVEIGLREALAGDDHCAGMEITFATNDAGDAWSYQTGDNSYVGGCYHMPWWAESSVYPYTTVEALYTDITSQLEEYLPV